MASRKLTSPAPLLLALTFVVTLVIVCFGEICSYGFTDVDTFSLINSGRYQSMGDVMRIFGSELMAGRMINAIYYRPLTTFVYGTEYHLFGLSARGYHAVDLLLFTATAAAILGLGARLWGGRRGLTIGTLAAALFVLHPLQIDNVPAIARMGDLLAGFLAASSWLFFVLFYTAKRPRWLLYVVSVLAAFAGLFAKEPAIVASAAIFFTILAFSQKPAWLPRLRELATLMTPYALATVFFLCCRTKILGGLGGYVSKRGVFSDPTVLQFDFRLKTTFVGHIVGLLAPSLSDNFDRYAQFLMGHGLIVKLLVLATVAAWFYFAQRTLRSKSIDARAALVFSGMLLAHGALLFMTLLMLRYLYLSTIPVCLLLALLTVKLSESLEKGLTWQKSGALILGALIAGLLLAHSPVWNKTRLRRWKMGTDISEHVLRDVQEITQRHGSEHIYLLNIPYILVFGSTAPTFLELPFNQMLLEHALHDYLDLMGHPSASRLTVVNYLFLQNQCDIRVETHFSDAQTIAVRTQSNAVASPFPWSVIPGRSDHHERFGIEGGKVNFTLEPKGGWPRDQTIHLLSAAHSESRAVFYAWNGQAFEQIAAPLK